MLLLNKISNNNLQSRTVANIFHSLNVYIPFIDSSESHIKNPPPETRISSYYVTASNDINIKCLLHTVHSLPRILCSYFQQQCFQFGSIVEPQITLSSYTSIAVPTRESGIDYKMRIANKLRADRSEMTSGDVMRVLNNRRYSSVH